MTIAAAYCSGCSIVAMAAHQAPADSAIVAQDERPRPTRSVRWAHAGTSLVNHVSTDGPLVPPSTHSVSTPAGNSVIGEIVITGPAVRAATAASSAPPRSIESIHSAGSPGYPGKVSSTG